MVVRELEKLRSKEKTSRCKITTRDTVLYTAKVNIAVSYKVKRVNPKSSHHKGKICSLFTFLLYLYEKMSASSICCGNNNFTIYVDQTIVLYVIKKKRSICFGYAGSPLLHTGFL